jgi:hypothetical protein
MNIRLSIAVFCAVSLFAFASSPVVGANLLIDPEFDGIPPLLPMASVFPPSVSATLGNWGAENGAIVGVDDGVTPLTAQTMLAEYSPAGGYTQTGQLTDVSSDPAGSTYLLSAYFNVNNHVPAASAFVNISFYDASYALVGSPPSAGLILDNNISTWEQISLTATAPLTTKYVFSQVLYDENTLPGVDGLVHAGYVDSASLTVVPEPSAIILIGLGALGLLVVNWRRIRTAS